MTDPTPRRELFTAAVQLLGGARASARTLEMQERSLNRLVSGQHDLHDGFMRDASAALVEHAAACLSLSDRIDAHLAGDA